MSKGKILGVSILILSAPVWMSGYWAVVTGSGFLPPASNDGINFFRVMVGIYGPLCGIWALHS